MRALIAAVSLMSACSFSPSQLSPLPPDIGAVPIDTGTFLVDSGMNRDSGEPPDSTAMDAAVTPDPVARDDAFSTMEDVPLAIDPLANDDGVGLVLELLTVPVIGRIDRDVAGALTYVPAADRAGMDRFVYRIRDREGRTASATVSITVTPVNDAPIAREVRTRTPYEAHVDVLLDGADPDNDPITYTVVRGPTSGRLGTVATSPPRVRYTPIRGFHGLDRFLYQTSDGRLISRTATVTVLVLPSDWQNANAELRRTVCVDGTTVDRVNEFPLLVAAPPRAFLGARSGGVDLTFYSLPMPARIPHEIERWSPDGTSAIWLRMPRVDTATTSCAMAYYAIPFPPPAVDPRTVWSAEFARVAHLGDIGTEATSGDPLLVIGTTTVAGAVAAGDRFGPSTTVDLTPSGLDYEEGTVSAWIRLDPNLDLIDDGFVLYGTSTSSGAGHGFEHGEAHLGLDRDEHLRWFVRDDRSFDLVAPTALATGTWRYVAVTWVNGDDAILYVDGVEVARAPYDVGRGGKDRALLRLGAPYDPTSRHFLGDLDDVRVARVARTPAWIALEYRTVADATLVELGPVQDGTE